ncbi:MAG: ATP-binding protein [Candidatus Komeilibacteria bacterium]|nr:ATP-binding protein [Candidatus Komeilibacteria bacterium]
MLDLSIWIILIIITSSLFLGLVAFFKNPKNKTNRLFLLMIIFVVIWQLSNFFENEDISHNLAKLFLRIDFASAVFVGYSWLMFVLNFFQGNRLIVKPVIKIITFFISLLLALLSFTNLIIFNISFSNGSIRFDNGYLWLFYALAVIAFFVISYAILILNLLKSRGLMRMQILYIFLGFSISSIIALVINLFLSNSLTVDQSRIGLYGIIVFIICTFYAVIKYRLMDIRIVAGKIISYLLIAAFAYVTFYAVTGLNNSFFGSIFTTNAYLLGIPLALCFSIIFTPFQRLVQKLTKHYLFAGVYNSQETLENLTNQLTTIINLNQVIDLVVDTIKNTLYLDKSGVLLIDQSVQPVKYQIAKVIGFNRQNGISLVQNNFLTQYLTKNQKPLVKEELDFLSEQAKNENDRQSFVTLKNHMTKIEASLCLPLISNNQLIGIIVLGDKISGGAYSQEDLKLLSLLSSQASIAITNARYYKETQDFNKTLQTKVDEQTKDIQEKAVRLEKLLKMRSEFLDIASHQLRTPTSVIKGTLSMMKEGDLDKMSSKEKTYFVEGMFQKSVKLESIINDILVASEMDTADFDIKVEDEIELDKFVEKEVSEHQFDAQEKNITLTFEKLTPGPFKIKGSAKYLEQVIDNLISNALKYTLKGSIKTTIKQDGKDITIAVSDTGIGIPKDDMERIFNKFIRGKNARDVYTDGSGLGLFIIKRVMDQHPNSKVWVESEEGKGSNFYLQFPLLK